MSSRSVAVIGTADPEEGWGMAYYHGDAYESLDGCELVACADIVRENAEAFAETYGIPESNVYEDYEEMLTDVQPEVVSVPVSAGLHAELVVGAARTGVPEAIHCEKPMADTWRDSRLIAQECRRRDIQLTIDHQRRFGAAWQRAKTLLDDGEIGRLERVEAGPPNFFDSGTHRVDLCNYYAGDRPARWVLGNVDYRTENSIFGVHHSDQALACWKYETGVHGFASAGDGSDAVGADVRLIGADGVIEVDITEYFGDRYDAETGRAGRGERTELRLRRSGEAAWEQYQYEEMWTEMIRRGIADLLSSLEDESEPELSARKALDATEILFGTYESARRRGRVDLPLEIDDHPLEEMIEAGDLPPEPTDQ